MHAKIVDGNAGELAKAHSFSAMLVRWTRGLLLGILFVSVPALAAWAGHDHGEKKCPRVAFCLLPRAKMS